MVGFRVANVCIEVSLNEFQHCVYIKVLEFGLWSYARIPILYALRSVQ